jgi:hypothetical protein
MSDSYLGPSNSPNNQDFLMLVGHGCFHSGGGNDILELLQMNSLVLNCVAMMLYFTQFS